MIIQPIKLISKSLISSEVGGRKGKTGLAHEATRQFHSRCRIPAVVHLPHAPEAVRRKIQRMLSPWMKVVARVSE